MKWLNKITILIWPIFASSNFIGYLVSFFSLGKNWQQLQLHYRLHHACINCLSWITFQFDWQYSSFALLITWILMDLCIQLLFCVSTCGGQGTSSSSLYVFSIPQFPYEETPGGEGHLTNMGRDQLPLCPL